MNTYKKPTVIVLTASPKELRDLADKMERLAPTLDIGEDCYVTTLAFDKNYSLQLFFDQTKTKGSRNYQGE